MLLEIKDNVIWVTHLKENDRLYRKVIALRDEEIIQLRIDGIVGKWAKMKTGADGRPTLALKPIGAMATVWSRYQSRRGEKVDLSLADDAEDPLLRFADMTFEEWNTAEDEEAFGDLQTV